MTTTQHTATPNTATPEAWATLTTDPRPEYRALARDLADGLPADASTVLAAHGWSPDDVVMNLVGPDLPGTLPTTAEDIAALSAEETESLRALHLHTLHVLTTRARRLKHHLSLTSAPDPHSTVRG